MKRSVVLAINQDAERDVIHALLLEGGFDVYPARTGHEALCLVEDHPQCFLVTDAQLTDMTAWALLGKLKEVIHLAAFRMVVLAHEPQVAHPAVSFVTVLVRPVSAAILRRTIEKMGLL